MKNIYSYIGLLGIILNSFIGIILSSYLSFNWVANDIIILVNMILIMILSHSKFKDGFKISFSFILPFIGVVQFITGFFLDNKVEDNFLLILIVGMFIIQLFFMIIGAIVSKYA